MSGVSAARFEVVVLGLGGMGSATLYHLAKRGVRVCGIERFGVGHDRGSSHGETRIIRKAYFEHPDYVPLLNRAYELWHALENESGTRLLAQSGLLFAAPPDSPYLPGLERCYSEHDLPHEEFGMLEACARFPQFRLPEPYRCFYDPQGGYLHVEACVQQHIALARHHGAEIRLDTPVHAWEAGPSGVRVTTANGIVEAERLVVTAGPWAAQLVTNLGVPLRVLRKVQLWYTSPRLAEFRLGAFPAYFVDHGYGGFYGFPAVNPSGMKVAEHSGGEAIADPDEVDRGLNPRDEERVLRFLHESFPTLTPHRTRFSVCMYTMSPDEHFILDQHPEHASVTVAAGFSGHGFKFAAVVGEILADLALHGTTPHPIDFLRLGRFNKNA